MIMSEIDVTIKSGKNGPVISANGIRQKKKLKILILVKFILLTFITR